MGWAPGPPKAAVAPPAPPRLEEGARAGGEPGQLADGRDPSVTSPREPDHQQEPEDQGEGAGELPRPVAHGAGEVARRPGEGRGAVLPVELAAHEGVEAGAAHLEVADLQSRTRRTLPRALRCRRTERSRRRFHGQALSTSAAWSGWPDTNVQGLDEGEEHGLGQDAEAVERPVGHQRGAQAVAGEAAATVVDGTPLAQGLEVADHAAGPMSTRAPTTWARQQRSRSSPR